MPRWSRGRRPARGAQSGPRLRAAVPGAHPAGAGGHRPQGEGAVAAGDQGLLPPRRRVAGRRRDRRAAPGPVLHPTRTGHRPGAGSRAGEPLAARRHPGAWPRGDLLAVAADGEAGPPRRPPADRPRTRSGAGDPRRHRREVPVRVRPPAGDHPAAAAGSGGLRRRARRGRRRRRRAQDPRGPGRQACCPAG